MNREDRLEEALKRIKRWANAYPVSIFPPPTEDDFERIRKILEEHGLNLGTISADCMRHVLDGVRRIVNEALSDDA